MRNVMMMPPALEEDASLGTTFGFCLFSSLGMIFFTGGAGTGAGGAGG